MRFVHGVEISVSWGGITIHVVGLNIDPELVHCRRAAMDTPGAHRRAARMAEELAEAGIPGSLEGAYAYVETPISSAARISRASWWNTATRAT